MACTGTRRPMPSLLFIDKKSQIQTCEMRPRNIAKAWRVCPALPLELKDNSMNKDRIKGAAREMRGKIKEATGKVTGNTKLEAKGFAQKVAGKARNTMGQAEDAARKL